MQYLKGQDQRQRIALLGRYLGKFQIEKLMENLINGYLRALDDADPERRAQIWSMLGTAETELSEQLRRFVEDFSKVWGDKTQVSTLRLALPYANKLFPRAAFDLRHALAIHAERHRCHGGEPAPALAARQGLHHVGRDVADAAQLPLVLPLQGRGLGTHAGAPSDPPCTADRVRLAADARGLLQAHRLPSRTRVKAGERRLPSGLGVGVRAAVRILQVQALRSPGA